MRKQSATGNVFILICMVLLAIPVLVLALPEQSQPAPPPIGSPLVREGTLAVQLQRALAVGVGEDEAEAESNLAALGIVPRNGWIADYPVTPDIIGELYTSVQVAAAAGKLSMGVAEAQKRLAGVIDALGLMVRPADDSAAVIRPPVNPIPPVPDTLHEYYTGEGPPIVTYYAPPSAYYSMYAWVPYPFWWSGFHFSGFFILSDFHRPVFIGNRPVYISNHFRDIRRHRVFRIDPYQRYRGETYSGIGVRRRNSISTGVPRSDRTIFNRERIRESSPGGLEREHRRNGAPESLNERKPRGGAQPPVERPESAHGREPKAYGEGGSGRIERGGEQRR